MTHSVEPIHRAWLLRSLDPASSLGEAVFGLIMALTVTLGTGVAKLEQPGAHQALIAAAVGCNLAWGLIDGAMFLMNAVFQRSRRARLLAALRGSADADESRRIVAEELDPILGPVSAEPERGRFYEHIAQVGVRATPERVGVRRADFAGAVATFVLVVAAAIPASVPFLIITDPRTALRVSNVLLLGLLFGVGWLWAGYTSFPRWRMAAALTGLGLLMVGIAIPLGG